MHICIYITAYISENTVTIVCGIPLPVEISHPFPVISLSALYMWDMLTTLALCSSLQAQLHSQLRHFLRLCRAGKLFRKEACCHRICFHQLICIGRWRCKFLRFPGLLFSQQLCRYAHT